MARAWMAWIAIGLATAAGCTMCPNPYDECGPLANGECPHQCKSSPRAGSILSGAALHPATRDESTPGQVISVTDQKLETPLQPPETAISPPVPNQPVDGWKPSSRRQPPTKAGGL